MRRTLALLLLLVPLLLPMPAPGQSGPVRVSFARELVDDSLVCAYFTTATGAHGLASPVTVVRPEQAPAIGEQRRPVPMASRTQCTTLLARRGVTLTLAPRTMVLQLRFADDRSPGPSIATLAVWHPRRL